MREDAEMQVLAAVAAPLVFVLVDTGPASKRRAGNWRWVVVVVDGEGGGAVHQASCSSTLAALRVFLMSLLISAPSHRQISHGRK